jgi:hypothetical protein
VLGNTERVPGNLLTAVVMLDTKRGNWEVTWAGDGAWPKDLRAGRNYRRGPMYDISAGPDGYRAHDLEDKVPAIQGATLEDLVAAAEDTPGAGAGHCMFRWVRPVASLEATTW